VTGAVPVWPDRVGPNCHGDESPTKLKVMIGVGGPRAPDRNPSVMPVGRGPVHGGPRTGAKRLRLFVGGVAELTSAAF
jgi:hypothetical protein